MAAQVNRLQNNAHWQEMLPLRLKLALILDVVRGAEAPLFRVTARHGALLSAFMMLDFGSALIRSWLHSENQ